MEQPQTPRSDERVEIVDVGPAPTSLVTRDEIASQVATAQQYPRSIVECQKTLLELACLDEQTAISCSYSFSRGGKGITGPSIHFAKMLSFAWKHIRVQGRVIRATATEVVAEGICWDTERNVAWCTESRRPIVYSDKRRKGERYSDDMVSVTGMAAISIAQRNAVLKTVPEPLWRSAYTKIRDTARGSAATLEARRTQWIKWFDEEGVKPDQLLRLVGAAGWADVTLDHIVQMQGIAQAIIDKDITVLELLAEVQAKPEDGKSSSLKEAIDKRNKKETEADGKIRGDAETGDGTPADHVQP